MKKTIDEMIGDLEQSLSDPSFEELSLEDKKEIKESLDKLIDRLGQYHKILSDRLDT